MKIFARTQLNALLRAAGQHLTALSAVLSGWIDMPAEVLVGDTIDATNTVDTTTLSNSPTGIVPATGLNVFKNGVSQGPSYTASSGDIDAQISVGKLVTNAGGTAFIASAVTRVAAVPDFASLGLLGGNVGGSTNYYNNGIFLNAAFDGKGWTAPGLAANNVCYSTLTLSSTGVGSATASSSGANFAGNSSDVGKVIYVDGGTMLTVTAYIDSNNATVTVPTALSTNTFYCWYWGTIALDANGYPLQTLTPTQCELTLGVNYIQNGVSMSGTLPPSTTLPDGVYHCTISSTAAGMPVSSVYSCSGATMSNTVTVGGVTTFDLTVTAPSVVTLRFTNGMQFFDCPRDGSATSLGKGKFYSKALKHYAKLTLQRFMDFTTTNFNTAREWGDRPPAFAFPLRPYSWELLFELIIALKGYAGTKFTTPWINLSPLMSPACAAKLAQLANTMGVPQGAIVEPNNEPWNDAFTQKANASQLASDEIKLITNYSLTGQVAAVTSDGSAPNSLITVTTYLPITTYPFIVAGAPLLVSDISSQGWNSRAGATVQSVDTVANTFTYLAAGVVATGTAFIAHGGAKANTETWSATFNLNSNLVSDWGTNNSLYNVFNLPLKWYVRQVYLVQQAWKVYRPNDKFVLNIQSYGGALPGGTQAQPLHFDYGEWLSNTYYGTGHLDSWLYGASMGSYISATANSTPQAVFDQLGYETAPGMFTGALLTTSLQHRSHVSTCLKYRVRPMIYEGGPDLQRVPALVYELSTDPRMGDLVRGMLNSWFYAGGKEFNCYRVTPGYFQDGNAQSCWYWLNSFDDIDVTATKWLAVQNYSKPRTFCPTGIADIMTNASYQRRANAPFTQTTTGMTYWNTTTAGRAIDYTYRVERAGYFNLTAIGTDNATVNTHNLVVDGNLAGTVTLPKNGAGLSSTAVAAAAPPVRIFLAAGSHNISFQPQGVTSPGILRIDASRA